jgi:hypothetical protein
MPCQAKRPIGLGVGCPVKTKRGNHGKGERGKGRQKLLNALLAITLQFQQKKHCILSHNFNEGAD